jgi:hypothetical protein
VRFTGRVRDLGALDESGRLRLLGRSDDVCLAGRWPPDTLDLIGPVLGPRCAGVRHVSSQRVIVRLWDALGE